MGTSAVDVAGLGASQGFAIDDAGPVGGGGAVSVTAQFDDRGDESPEGEGGEEDEEYHGRNATVDVDPPRVAGWTHIV